MSVIEVISRLTNEGGGDWSSNSKYNIDNRPTSSLAESEQEIGKVDCAGAAADHCLDRSDAPKSQ
jgi:hypothetical protein